MSKVKYGILGVGKLTSKSLVPAFKFCEQSELVALGSQNIPVAQKKVKGVTGSIFWGSYEEVLDHPDVQVVYIVLPNHLHAEWSIKAMQKGKAVLCEKPLCTSMVEFDAIEKASIQTSQIYAEAFMYRLHPQYQKVKEILDSGVLGELQLFRGQFSYYLEDVNNIRLKPECNGGALMDVGCYLLDALITLSGSEIHSIDQQLVMEEHGTDLSTSLQVKMKSGLMAQLFCSTRSSRSHFYQWLGSKGSLEVPEAFIPAAGKQVHLILKTERGQEVIKIPGANSYSLEMDHFSANFLAKKSFGESGLLMVNKTLHQTLETLKQKN